MKKKRFDGKLHLYLFSWVTFVKHSNKRAYITVRPWLFTVTKSENSKISLFADILALFYDII